MKENEMLKKEIEKLKSKKRVNPQTVKVLEEQFK